MPMPRSREEERRRDRSAASKVEELVQREDGTWHVITNQGEIHRRACRQRRRPVGARGRPHGRAGAAGARHGAHVPHHRGHAGGRRLQQAETGRELMHAVDFDGEIYLRQERQRHADGHLREGLPSPGRRSPRRGISAMNCWPRTSSASRRRSKSASGISRAFKNAGIKKIINGPFTFSPDGNPAGRAGAGPDELLVGLRRHGRLSPGRRRRAGARPTGWSTAIPASTSGPWTSRATANGRRLAYTNAKVRENYSRRFSIRYPNEELPAGAAAADDAGLRHAQGRRWRHSASS